MSQPLASETPQASPVEALAPKIDPKVEHAKGLDRLLNGIPGVQALRAKLNRNNADQILQTIDQAAQRASSNPAADAVVTSVNTPSGESQPIVVSASRPDMAIESPRVISTSADVNERARIAHVNTSQGLRPIVEQVVPPTPEPAPVSLDTETSTVVNSNGQAVDVVGPQQSKHFSSDMWDGKPKDGVVSSTSDTDASAQREAIQNYQARGAEHAKHEPTHLEDIDLQIANREAQIRMNNRNKDHYNQPRQLDTRILQAEIDARRAYKADFEANGGALRGRSLDAYVDEAKLNAYQEYNKARGHGRGEWTNPVSVISHLPTFDHKHHDDYVSTLKAVLARVDSSGKPLETWDDVKTSWADVTGDTDETPKLVAIRNGQVVERPDKLKYNEVKGRRAMNATEIEMKIADIQHDVVNPLLAKAGEVAQTVQENIRSTPEDWEEAKRQMSEDAAKLGKWAGDNWQKVVAGGTLATVATTAAASAGPSILPSQVQEMMQDMKAQQAQQRTAEARSANAQHVDDAHTTSGDVIHDAIVKDIEDMGFVVLHKENKGPIEDAGGGGQPLSESLPPVPEVVAVAEAPEAEVGNVEPYTVQPGDTIWGVAEKKLKTLQEEGGREYTPNDVRVVAAAIGGLSEKGGQINPGDTLTTPTDAALSALIDYSDGVVGDHTAPEIEAKIDAAQTINTIGLHNPGDPGFSDVAEAAKTFFDVGEPHGVEAPSDQAAQADSPVPPENRQDGGAKTE